jgi:DNA polymerase (family 10)
MPEINDRIAKLFRQYAILIVQDGEENKFKINSYNKAALTIEKMQLPVTKESLDTIPGVGEKLTGKIAEILDTGDFSQRKELAIKHDDIMCLIEIPNVGPKRAMAYSAEIKAAGMTVTVENFKTLVANGKIKVPANIKAGLDSGVTATARVPYAMARPLADATIAVLQQHTTRISAAGSLRRQKDTIGDIDILATTDTPNALINAFCASGTVLARGDTKVAKAIGNIQIDLRIVKESEWGAALIYFTGSKNFNIRMRNAAISKGWTLNEYELKVEATGQHIAGATEEEIFKALGWDYVEPKGREE